MFNTKTYILAVSGGVDSVFMMHRLLSVQPPNVMYVIAHFDHGMRVDSVRDAEFVKGLAAQAGVGFELGQMSLGQGASELSARDARYDFLQSVKTKYSADFIVTAHHSGDVVETMIINMLRGTGPKGLVGFSAPGVLRPFINYTKQQILDYVKENNLTWREDSTNADDKYKRNYIRHNIVPKLGTGVDDLLEIRQDLMTKMPEIDDLTKKMLVGVTENGRIKRSRFVPLPYIVQKQIVAMFLQLMNIQIDAKLVERATLAIKTALPGVEIDLSGGSKLLIFRDEVSLKVAPRHV